MKCTCKLHFDFGPLVSEMRRVKQRTTACLMWVYVQSHYGILDRLFRVNENVKIAKKNLRDDLLMSTARKRKEGKRRINTES